MNLYILKPIQSDKIGIPTTVVVDCERLADAHYYSKSMNKHAFMDDATPIYLELVKWAENPHKLRDYHYWGAGSPEGYRIICSKKFRTILQLLNLPPHRFYEAEIKVEQKIHNYYVLYILQDWYKVINYSKSVFNVVELMENDRIVKRLNAGEVKSYQNYNEIIEMITEIDQYLNPAKLHFLPHIKYDVWGLHGQIILSEHAKQMIEAAQITGVSMPEMQTIDFLQNIEIVMNGQTYSPENQFKTTEYETNLQTANIVAESETKYGTNL